MKNDPFSRSEISNGSFPAVAENSPKEPFTTRDSDLVEENKILTNEVSEKGFLQNRPFCVLRLQFTKISSGKILKV